jgi:SAM-dependent methyltransferase
MLVVGDGHRNSPPGLARDPVGEFYTHHPYPPPVANLDRARDEWQDLNRHRSEFHLYWPERAYRSELDILVAGCGTWQAARYALCHPAARVTGIDVSPTSIDHTDKLKREYNLTNLELRQVPVEQAATLARDFDLIVCTGVLHHLADPEEGLRALRSVLRPDGAMLLMVYGRYGRIGIEMLQAYCQKLGVGTTRAEIDDLTAVLDVLPPHHPAVALLRGARDAHDRDALADALLNPREQAYSVPQLFDVFEPLADAGAVLAAMRRNLVDAARDATRCASGTRTIRGDGIVARDDRAPFGRALSKRHEPRAVEPVLRPAFGSDPPAVDAVRV